MVDHKTDQATHEMDAQTYQAAYDLVERISYTLPESEYKLFRVSWYNKSGILLEYATNTILLDNVISGNPGNELGFGVFAGGGHSNKILLNAMENALNPAIFYLSPNGVFGSDVASDVAVDEYFNPVPSLDPAQDFSRLRGCAGHLTDTESVGDFRECVDEALEELH